MSIFVSVPVKWLAPESLADLALSSRLFGKPIILIYSEHGNVCSSNYYSLTI